MSGEPLADRAARFAAAVAWLDEPAWSGRVAAIAGDVPRAPSRPTYRELATAGTGLVAALADEGRWAEAADEARDLKRLFGATPDQAGSSSHATAAANRAARSASGPRLTPGSACGGAPG